MTTFSTRQYKVIASLLGEAIRSAEDSASIDSLPETALYTFRDMLADEFAEDNPSFNKDMFHRAVMREGSELYESTNGDLASVIERAHEAGYLIHTLCEHPANDWLATLVKDRNKDPEPGRWRYARADTPAKAITLALEQEEAYIKPAPPPVSIESLFASIRREDTD